MTQELSLQKILETQISQLSDGLAKGQAKSYDEYRYIVGQVESCRRTINILRDFAKSTQIEE